MEVKDSFYALVEKVCSELYIRSLKEIPPDVVEAIKRAGNAEQHGQQQLGKSMPGQKKFHHDANSQPNHDGYG